MHRNIFTIGAIIAVVLLVLAAINFYISAETEVEDARAAPVDLSAPA
ncbi:hypothetical protein [Tranquillimonas alkanivorans]|uniref:Uncharacterized protein n=1 Tax=Tranquillimonas alkanivorans TaxID=441119 RepID=A0A1I5NQX4_9RHOB|nr:hypothetical protein [Tranquillimonas alkanivorans]SFP24060.1 hypothetical protein SAMN04488047_10432 [Tranquillimonas alkanivorans]